MMNFRIQLNSGYFGAQTHMVNGIAWRPIFKRGLLVIGKLKLYWGREK
jgi:hypothetical protein